MGQNGYMRDIKKEMPLYQKQMLNRKSKKSKKESDKKALNTISH